MNTAPIQPDFDKTVLGDPGRVTGGPAAVVPPRDGRRAPAERPHPGLTEREKQVLRLVCDGMTNAQIALRLGISSETVKSGLKRMFQKIEVRNRTQAAVLLVRQGLLGEA